MCEECRRPALGSIFCERHLPTPYTASPEPGTRDFSRVPDPSPEPDTRDFSRVPSPVVDYGAHPAVAFILGFIPGVGAIYNGQYAKGLIHVVVFGLLVSLAGSHSTAGSLEPLIGLLIAAWVFYMAFEAYHTARKRRYGVAVEEFSSLIDVRSTQGGRFPAGAVVLIALGVILLLDTTGIIAMDEMERYWPVGLIVFGVYLLFVRMNAASRHSGDNAGDGTEVRR
jgi:TM2 domain-containing membrane protein YozV